MTKFTKSVLADVERERDHQREIWGDEHDDKHKTSDFIDFIGIYTDKAYYAWEDLNPSLFRKRLIQVAALAVAAAETIDRANESA